ncbi:MAG: tRNA (guanosine(46)-N7)-methyltransferase TrmB [Bacteroidetes bacterium]|nr:tRNA (guanosine(46)-N7)-methyltransferase TrmB [Bacteroidota bacterium]
MTKRKLQRFEELKGFERTFQFPFPLVHTDHGLRGNWKEKVFQNSHPIVLEVGCGRGEYTVELARNYPELNFIGIDIKGARIWRGAKTINEEHILNGAFLRVHVEWLKEFFAPGEVKEIWVTFPDPQPQLSRENRRLTNPKFLQLYRYLSGEEGVFHLKTDNYGLFEYTLEMLSGEQGTMEACTDDLYGNTPEGFNLSIQTTYEKKFLQEGLKINYLRFRWA